MDSLVSTDWLEPRLRDADLRVLDATWFIDGRDAAAEFEAEHIPGARFLDLKSLADPVDPLPMMLPPAGLMTERLAALGVAEADRIVIYDNSPFKTAARAWWMFARVYGLSRVSVLDGGLAKWKSEGRPLEDTRHPGPSTASKADVRSRGDEEIRNLAAMRANLDSGAEQVIDARGASRFAGTEPEPRTGVTPGHIPGSVNLPYTRLFNGDGTYKQGDALRAAFDHAGVDLERPMVATCGSGITAAVLVFGAHVLGRDMALYDGSWSEWGAHPDTPKATGGA